MYPRNFPEVTPKTQLSGLSRRLYLRRLLKLSQRLASWSPISQLLIAYHPYRFSCLANLGGKYLIDHALVRGSHVLQAEGYDLRAVNAILSYKCGFIHILLYHEYQVVPLERRPGSRPPRTRRWNQPAYQCWTEGSNPWDMLC
ncbi:hypothetical protein LIER_35951 [Lithospermum erythrorhizon]|uniref:Uncharacterized protein n=1 Tax=Lithospermum erythrorhizon TaxID=34254 RepID=A0AAV3NZJ2_LITER